MKTDVEDWKNIKFSASTTCIRLSSSGSWIDAITLTANQEYTFDYLFSPTGAGQLQFTCGSGVKITFTT